VVTSARVDGLPFPMHGRVRTGVMPVVGLRVQ
jgi:hypothetical protein